MTTKYDAIIIGTGQAGPSLVVHIHPTVTELIPTMLADLELEPIIITKHGKPVAKIVPIIPVRDMLENPLKNSVVFYGDIESPITSPD